MKFAVQLDNPSSLQEALNSSCDEIRFGSEFCEWKIPKLNRLKEVYNLTEENMKEFTYVTPLVSNDGLETIKTQLDYLNEKRKINVVVNDLGILDLIKNYQNLTPQLGRQLITAPGRSPWTQITRFEVGFLEKRRVEKPFYQTSLNFEETISFFKEHGIQRSDMDWISKGVKYLDFIIQNGIKLSVHLQSVLVTLTRRCHMTRFLEEERPETRTKPCFRDTFLLKQEILGVEMFLFGNVVLRFVQPSRRDIKKIGQSWSD